MNVPNLKVAVVQMTSNEDVENNLKVLISGLDDAWKTSGPFDLASTPENSLFMRMHEGAIWPTWNLESSFWQPLQTWAKEHQCAIHLGSVALTNPEGLRSNATLWISDQGNVSSPYQKIHLFDVDVPGAPSVRESAQFQHGEKPETLEYRGWKLGLSICYDLRFSALFQLYQMAEADAILIPSAFLVPTGRAHWEILLRARAIESQAYVLAAAQGGTHFGPNQVKRETWGHSMVVDPWGDVMLDATCTGVSVVTLQKTRIAKVRSQIPMKNHHRLWKKS